MVSADDQQLKNRSKNDWYDVTIKGADHGHFSDLVLLYPESAGALKALRAYEIINSLTVSFFDYYLKKEPSELLDNPKKRTEMGLAGNQKLINELSWESIAKRTNNVYRQILGLTND